MGDAPRPAFLSQESIYAEVFRTAAAPMLQSVVLSARSAAQQQLLFVQEAVVAGDEVGELARLRDQNRRLKSENPMPKAGFGTDDEQTPICDGTPESHAQPRGQPESGMLSGRLHGRLTATCGSILRREGVPTMHRGMPSEQGLGGSTAK